MWVAGLSNGSMAIGLTRRAKLVFSLAEIEGKYISISFQRGFHDSTIPLPRRQSLLSRAKDTQVTGRSLLDQDARACSDANPTADSEKDIQCWNKVAEFCKHVNHDAGEHASQGHSWWAIWTFAGARKRDDGFGFESEPLGKISVRSHLSFGSNLIICRNVQLKYFDIEVEVNKLLVPCELPFRFPPALSGFRRSVPNTWHGDDIEPWNIISLPLVEAFMPFENPE
jgi:hypothetical protein